METDPNIVGTMIQLTGTLLVSVLCSILLQTVRTPFLYYWGYGWAAMSAALLSLMLALVLQDINPILETIANSILVPAYCFAEYAAGFFWIAGCRSLAVGVRLVPRDVIWVFPVGVAAVIVPRVVGNPNGAGILAFHGLHSLMKTG